MKMENGFLLLTGTNSFFQELSSFGFAFVFTCGMTSSFTLTSSFTGKNRFLFSGITLGTVLRLQEIDE